MPAGAGRRPVRAAVVNEAAGLSADHREIADDLVARGYFLQLRRIAAALTPALDEMVRDRIFGPTDVQVIRGHVGALLATVPHERAGAIEVAVPAALPPTLFSRIGNVMAAIVAVMMSVAAIAIRRRGR